MLDWFKQPSPKETQQTQPMADAKSIEASNLTIKNSRMNTENKNVEQDKLEGLSLDTALQIYKEELSDFVNSLGKKINKYSKATIKNYVEDVEYALIQLIKDDLQQDRFVDKITDSERENIEEIKTREERRRKIIIEAYETVKKINK